MYKGKVVGIKGIVSSDIMLPHDNLSSIVVKISMFLSTRWVKRKLCHKELGN